jgi:ABC-type transport system involved in cytochrome c biogenesis permease subunit
MVFRFARADAVPKPGLPAGWLLLHVLGLVVASACFTTAAGVAGAWLVQARQLKRKALDALSYELPPLESLDGLAAGLAAAGLLTWVLGLLAGFVWRLNWDGQWGLGDPSVLFALGIAVAYGVALFLRARGALRGRRLALLFILLFLVILFGYYLVNLYFGGHGFLQSKLGA